MRNADTKKSEISLVGPSEQYQFCVDAGASAAESFFDELAAVGLHDHIACSMHVFTASVRSAMAATGDKSPASMQLYVDAFAVGYLGRIQQELRLFHGKDTGRIRGCTSLNEFINSDSMH